MSNLINYVANTPNLANRVNLAEEQSPLNQETSLANERLFIIKFTVRERCRAALVLLLLYCISTAAYLLVHAQMNRNYNNIIL